MAHYILTPNTRVSMKEIAIYTQNKWGKQQRDKYLKALRDRFEDLASNPEKGKHRTKLHPHLRSYVEGRHVIYYLPNEDYIVIVGVLHERMDPSRRVHMMTLDTGE